MKRLFFDDNHIFAREMIIHHMKRGGYYESIMESGAELDRVKDFLLMLSGEKDNPVLREGQDPRFLPIFPGLEGPAIYEADANARRLAAYLSLIKSEIQKVIGSQMDYDGGLVAQGAWKVIPLFYMSVELEHLTQHCPGIVDLVCSMDRTSVRSYPFSDAVISRHSPQTRLLPHCSVDNLRVRYSFCVESEGRSWIKVAGRKVYWEEGQTIVFDDSYVHETSNDSDKDRIVLIADTWHPGLSDTEVEALSAGFMKAEVRASLYRYRLQEQWEAMLLNGFKQQDNCDLIKKYWKTES